jgi:hypothetical protein
MISFNCVFNKFQSIWSLAIVKNKIPNITVTYCGLYYKHVTIVNDASSGINK